MASFHQTIIIGHVGRDPESRFLASGDAVCNFSVAVTESWKDKNSGEKKENTTWYRVNAFGKLAEICGQYLKKGSQVQIVGKMQCREWEKDGVKQYSWELKAEQMVMLGGRPAGSDDGGFSQPAASQAKPEAAKKAGFDEDPDIPF